jgi:hypothetical protein
MKNVLLGFLVLTTLFLSCKKDEKTKSSPTPIGTWQVVQSQTTHELGHYGPYDPPVREIDSRETLTIDHQSDFTIIDVSTSSLTWTEFDTAPVIHTWTQTDDLTRPLSSLSKILERTMILLLMLLMRSLSIRIYWKNYKGFSPTKKASISYWKPFLFIL